MPGMPVSRWDWLSSTTNSSGNGTVPAPLRTKAKKPGVSPGLANRLITGTSVYATAQECQHTAVLLLTTFDAEPRRIAHQDVSIDTVLRQARHLRCPCWVSPCIKLVHNPTRLAFDRPWRLLLMLAATRLSRWCLVI